PELQGMWKLVSVESNGTATGLSDRQPRWIIKGNKVVYGGEEIALLTVDAAAAPKIIDLTFRDPKRVFEGIYAVEKDTLKICLNKQTDGVKERPDSFSTKDKKNRRLLTFEREKAGKDKDAMEGLTGFVGLVLRQDKDPNGVSLGDVLDGGPAKKAGLRKGDVLLKIGGEDMTEIRSAVEAVRRTRPGSELAFRIRRDGKESDVAVKVGVLPFTFVASLD